MAVFAPRLPSVRSRSAWPGRAASCPRPQAGGARGRGGGGASPDARGAREARARLPHGAPAPARSRCSRQLVRLGPAPRLPRSPQARLPAAAPPIVFAFANRLMTWFLQRTKRRRPEGGNHPS